MHSVNWHLEQTQAVYTAHIQYGTSFEVPSDHIEVIFLDFAPHAWYDFSMCYYVNILAAVWTKTELYVVIKHCIFLEHFRRKISSAHWTFPWSDIIDETKSDETSITTKVVCGSVTFIVDRDWIISFANWAFASFWNFGWFVVCHYIVFLHATLRAKIFKLSFVSYWC